MLELLKSLLPLGKFNKFSLLHPSYRNGTIWGAFRRDNRIRINGNTLECEVVLQGADGWEDTTFIWHILNMPADVEMLFNSDLGFVYLTKVPFLAISDSFLIYNNFSAVFYMSSPSPTYFCLPFICHAAFISWAHRFLISGQTVVSN